MQYEVLPSEGMTDRQLEMVGWRGPHEIWRCTDGIPHSCSWASWEAVAIHELYSSTFAAETWFQAKQFPWCRGQETVEGEFEVAALA